MLADNLLARKDFWAPSLPDFLDPRATPFL
jgi:hypothetical protein